MTTNQKDLLRQALPEFRTLLDVAGSTMMSLQEKLENNANLTIDCHKSCVSSYTSTHHVKVFNKRKHSQEPSSNLHRKTRRQSSACGMFDLLQDCLFCGDKCELQIDSKNPSRWRAAYKFRQILSPDRKTTLKESILETCAVRNDDLSEKVRLRIHGIVGDLHAAEARYHTVVRPLNFVCTMILSQPLAKAMDHF